MYKRQVIVIAHRLATTQEANKIVVFDKGQIIEVGKHIDLINELSNELKESIKLLQIAETQFKMHQDTLKLLSISRNSLVNQLREKLKNLE